MIIVGGNFALPNLHVPQDKIHNDGKHRDCEYDAVLGAEIQAKKRCESYEHQQKDGARQVKRSNYSHKPTDRHVTPTGVFTMLVNLSHGIVAQ